MKKLLFTTLLLCSLSSTGWSLDYDTTTGWTTGTDNEIKLSLRAVNRDNNSSLNNQGFYAFATGTSATDDSKALWDFQFLIDASSTAFTSHNFYLGIDVDPSEQVNYENSLHDALILAGNTPEDQANHKIVSLNIATFLSFSYGNQPGIYDFRLFAVAPIANSPALSSGGNEFIESLPTKNDSSPIADVNIRVIVGASSSPVPDAGSTLALIGLSLAGFAGISRRKIV